MQPKQTDRPVRAHTNVAVVHPFAISHEFTLLGDQVSFCLMKKARKCDSCHAQVTASTASWISVQRTTREFVDSD
jgi:hypothetical protein